MKLKKIIISIVIAFFLIQCVLEISCNATEELVNDSQIVILNDDKINHIDENIENNEELKIYSEAAILIEAKTGKILYEKDIHAKKYPASTTKVLTAIIALERCNLDETAIASYEAINSVKSGYSTANIQVGECFTLEELIDVMMIHSANEAANIIAEHISGSIEEFSNLMNEKAKEIGCLESNFVNPNGMHDENHYSSAYDLAMIARYCMQNEKFREIVTKMECKLPTTELWQEERVFKNTNSLLLEDNRYYYPYCNGIKTGFTTPAKNCLISSSNKDGFETISVVLHAEATDEGLSARYLDTINLFEYGYNNYNLEEILEEYDLIEYPENDEENSKSFSNFNKEINQDTILGVTIEKNNNLKNEWLKIFFGSAIILVIFIYYLMKRLKKNKEKYNEKLYNFKLNQ